MLRVLHRQSKFFWIVPQNVLLLLLLLLIFDSYHVAIATDALAYGWSHREPRISFNPEPEPILSLIKANKASAGEGLADKYSAI